MGIFGNGKDFENEIPKEDRVEESYMLSVVRLESGKGFHVIVRGREALSQLMSMMPSTKYYVFNISLLSVIKDYDEFMGELTQEAQEDDMNYGKER